MARSRLRIETEALNLAVDVYAATDLMPDSERFGLTREIRRSAVSIGSNIPEGSGRRSDRELTRFLDIAIGSSRELDFQIELAAAVGMLTAEPSAALPEGNGRLRGQILKLKERASADVAGSGGLARRSSQ